MAANSPDLLADLIARARAAARLMRATPTLAA